jgi:hypothetical protein
MRIWPNFNFFALKTSNVVVVVAAVVAVVVFV